MTTAPTTAPVYSLVVKSGWCRWTRYTDLPAADDAAVLLFAATRGRVTFDEVLVVKDGEIVAWLPPSGSVNLAGLGGMEMGAQMPTLPRITDTCPASATWR
ncbi:hypothetical protein [Saccharothrix sp. HUAS TT1]|uniref:hypothetical protein n=1 Tax=unclassified Saccharothrix TaxID=2593673 RepID=UPI00345B8A5A